MKGGMIPLLVWSALISALFAIHWVWTEDTLQNASQGFAIGLILTIVAAAVAHDRQVIHRGPPPVTDAPETVPTSSLGAVVVALAVVACGFGLVFGSFLVFIAAGMFAAGAFVLLRELRDERRALRGWVEKEGDQ